ncbi:MAG: hypothetical protein E7378_02355 [Clostridiales bacterium]|nr:hypothetical protein [Clostridiales bacterium]
MRSLLLNIGQDILDAIVGFLVFIPKIMYFLVACFMSLIDLCQIAFRKLAGLEPLMVNGEVYQGDTIYKVITDAIFGGKYPAIRTVFWALIILGVLMLIVTSIIAVIRLEYAPDEKTGNSKSKVVGNFFKALFNFAIIPIACFFGMYLTNTLVGAIDKATNSATYAVDIEYENYFKKQTADQMGDNIIMDNSDFNAIMSAYEPSYGAYNIFGLTIPTNSEPFSGIIFRASAYGCNRIRYTEGFHAAMRSDVGTITDFGIFGQVENREDAAHLLDSAFAINALPQNSATLNYDNQDFVHDGVKFIGTDKNISSFNKYNPTLVFYFYDLWSFNYIVAFMAVIVIGKTYYKFVLALMARLFEVAGLFLIAPIATSLMPLDNGNAMSAWRKSFISKFILVAIMVATLNLITPLITIAHNISLFGIPLIDYIITTLFLIAAINAADSLNTTLSVIFAGDKDLVKNAVASGENVQKGFMTGLAATANTAKAVGAASGVAFKAGAKVVGTAGRGVRALGRAAKEHSYNRRERAAIRSQLQDNADVADIAASWGDTWTQRRENADEFLASSSGQAFADAAYGGDMERARRALKSNFGVTGTSEAQQQARQIYHDWEREKQIYDSAGLSSSGMSLDEFRSKSQKEKVDLLMDSGSAHLTDKQAAIRQRRDDYLATRDMRRGEKKAYRRNKAWDDAIGGSDPIAAADAAAEKFHYEKKQAKKAARRAAVKNVAGGVGGYLKNVGTSVVDKLGHTLSQNPMIDFLGKSATTIKTGEAPKDDK